MKRIYFNGYMEIADDSYPDDLGSAQQYVVDFIKNCVELDNTMSPEEVHQYDMGSKLYNLLHLDIT